MTHLDFLTAQGLLWIDPAWVRERYLARGSRPIQGEWDALWADGSFCECGWTAAGLPRDIGGPYTLPLRPKDCLQGGFTSGFDESGAEGFAPFHPTIWRAAYWNGFAVWEAVSDLAVVE